MPESQRKERGEYNFLSKLKKDPKVWIQEMQETCSLALQQIQSNYNSNNNMQCLQSGHVLLLTY